MGIPRLCAANAHARGAAFSAKKAATLREDSAASARALASAISAHSVSFILTLRSDGLRRLLALSHRRFHAPYFAETWSFDNPCPPTLATNMFQGLGLVHFPAIGLYDRPRLLFFAR